MPYLGVYKREGYDLSEGAYAGAEASVLALKDKFKFRFRAQADVDHLTFAPALQFFGVNLEGMYKVAISDDNDGVKNSPAYSVNLRFAF